MSNCSIGNVRFRKARPAGRLRGRCAAFLSVLGLIGLVGCEDPTRSPDEPDRTSREAPAKRIVSLTHVATGFIVELGAGDQLVGVDAESARWPGLGALPIVDVDSAPSLDPDLVLLPDLGSIDVRALARLESQNIRLVEFAPHDLEDVGALSRGLGSELVGMAEANRFERRFSRPLALVAGVSPHSDRLRAVAIIELEPLTLAGGHSFETDLIEIGGGSAALHGGEASRILATETRWEEIAPDLVIVVTREEAGPVEKEIARARIPERFPIAFFAYDRETFWLHEPEQDAERMRELITRFSTTRP